MRKVLVFSLLCLLTGCSGENSHSNSDKSKSTYTVEGEKPDDFFQRFIATTDGSCATEIHFRFLSTKDTHVGATPEGKDIRATLGIFMNSDHTWNAKYEEDVVNQIQENGWAGSVLISKVLNGKWSIVEDRIVFDGLAEGIATKYNGGYAIELTMTADQNTPGLKGQWLLAQMVTSTDGLLPYSNYCPGQGE